MVDTLDNMLSKVQLVKVGNTLGIFNAEALLDTLVCALAEVEDKTLVTSRGDLEAEAVVVALADTLVEVEANTFVYTMSIVDTLAQTLTEVKAKELVHHLADTPAKVNAHTWRHIVRCQGRGIGRNAELADTWPGTWPCAV